MRGAVQAAEQARQQEDLRLLQGRRWDRSVGDSIRLAAEVKQLLMESTSMAQREERMAWRLDRWALRQERQQLLEVRTKRNSHMLIVRRNSEFLNLRFMRCRWAGSQYSALGASSC